MSALPVFTHTRALRGARRRILRLPADRFGEGVALPDQTRKLGQRVGRQRVMIQANGLIAGQRQPAMDHLAQHLTLLGIGQVGFADRALRRESLWQVSVVIGGDDLALRGVARELARHADLVVARGLAPAPELHEQRRLHAVAMTRQEDAAALFRADQPVLLETYLPGREFTVGVVGDGETTRALGTLEIVLLERAEPGWRLRDLVPTRDAEATAVTTRAGQLGSLTLGDGSSRHARIFSIAGPTDPRMARPSSAHHRTALSLAST